MEIVSDTQLQFIIVGVHRSSREVVVWAGKEGFMPVTAERQGSPLVPQVRIRAKAITGEVAEMIMKRITSGRVGMKYEFVLLPVVYATPDEDLARAEPDKLIIPGLH